jgi:lysophospholipase L1-like esterase
MTALEHEPIMFRRSLLAPCLLLALASPTLAQDFYLKDGDRVVFYGDSITEQRQYTVFAETFAVTRFPKREFTFVHSGWGGDRVTGGGGGRIGRRLERDVFAYKPNVVTIMLGMNDASYRPFDEKIFQTYANGYRHIVDELKAARPGVRITVIQPSPFDDVTRKPNFEGGYNAVLLKYSEFLKQLASETHCDLADLNTSVVEATERAFKTDPQLAEKLNPDRIHPQAGGQLLMAAALLKAWNAPALVSAVEIDAVSPKVNRAENAKVSDLAVKDKVLSWTQEDAALPFPIDAKDPAVALALKSSSVIKDLNQQTIKLVGATASKYALKIDDEKVGEFTPDELSEGINLAEKSTPMARQAAAVLDLTRKHTNLHQTRWRQIQVPLQDQISALGMAKVLEAMDEEEAKVVRKQHEAAQPKPHRFELAPQD